MSNGARGPEITGSATGHQPGELGGELPPPGTRIRQYELIRELGRGGMGAVYLARDTQLGRRVAIKFLQGNQLELTKRFELEARATAQLAHENIVVIHEVGAFQANPFMVLEYLQGRPLSKLLGGGQRLPPSRAVEIMVPVVRALVAAHEHDIVHRDLKPDNIFITDSGTVKVLDFGIAKLIQHDQAEQAPGRVVPPVPVGATDLTQHGALVGTLPYMSPEQWGMGTVDHRTDIWAIGILLYIMVTGRHPLAPRRGQQLMVTALLDEPMPSVRDAAQGLPDALVRTIDRCLIKRKEQRIGSARELLQHLEPLLPGRNTRVLSTVESPYAGLSSFQESDADRFFGRARDIAALVTRLRDQPLMGVVGPSGVGKSSFVRAGVVPALKQSGEVWETLVIRPGRNPLAALASVITSFGANSSHNNQNASSTTLSDDLSEQQALLQHLYRAPGLLGTTLRKRANERNRKIMLFVDQFEELYTLIPDIRERMAFTACLAGVADDPAAPLRVVLSIRSDFLDRVAEDQYFMGELAKGLFFLNPMIRDSLREALVQPAELADYSFESPRMIEHMLDTLETTPGALPLLQFTASKLWDARDTERKLLTEHSYSAMGGIVGALASHADAVLSELSPQAQGLIRAIFLRLVTPERTRAIASIAELRELSGDPVEIQRLIDHLVNARLLVVQSTGGPDGASVEIVHESLIHSWPLLRRWLDDNQDDAAFLEQLRTAAKQWDAKGRPAGLLWRGEALEEAKRWHRRYRGELPLLQRQYLDAVFTLGTRSTRLRRVLVAGTMTILTLMVAAAAVALVIIRDAERRATHQMAAAQIAEAQVRDQLEVIQAKEKERARAAEAAMAAQKEAEEAKVEVEQSKGEIERANEELMLALEKAKKAARRARKARKEAKANEAEALMAEAEAREANEELQAILKRERERLDRLESQLGSPLVEELK